MAEGLPGQSRDGMVVKDKEAFRFLLLHLDAYDVIYSNLLLILQLPVNNL